MTVSSDGPLVLTDLSDRVLTLTLNRPQRLNAFVGQMSNLLGEELAKAADNQEADVVVLTGAGRGFCVGGDVDAMEQLQKAPGGSYDVETMVAKATNIAVRLHRMPKPTIAMVNGVAAGGGVALALACDFRVVSTDATFTFAYTKIGLSGDFGINYFMRKVLGHALATELSLLCPKITAEEALRIGMATRVVEPGALAAETYALAGRMANGPRLAFASIKDNLRRAYDGTLEQAIDAEARNFVQLRESADHKEAARAFLEKRQPRFTGR